MVFQVGQGVRLPYGYGGTGGNRWGVIDLVEGTNARVVVRTGQRVWFSLKELEYQADLLKEIRREQRRRSRKGR